MKWFISLGFVIMIWFTSDNVHWFWKLSNTSWYFTIVTMEGFFMIRSITLFFFDLSFALEFTQYCPSPWLAAWLLPTKAHHHWLSHKLSVWLREIILCLEGQCSEWMFCFLAECISWNVLNLLVGMIIHKMLVAALEYCNLLLFYFF